MSIREIALTNQNSFKLRSPPAYLQLKKILSNYPEGTQIFKEGLQNADDSQATIYHVILSLKKYSVSNKQLERLSGPAIYMYNNSNFTDSDWRSFQRIFISEKANSTNKIGKFGMGSRSFFHLTDIVQVISGNYYAYLDPNNLISDEGGEKINFLEFHTNLLDKYCMIETLDEHLQAFKLFDDFNENCFFDGTIIRLALRQGIYVKDSNFAPYEYSSQKVSNLLHLFAIEADQCLLFLNNITTIKISFLEQCEEKVKTYSVCTKEILKHEYYSNQYIDEYALKNFPPNAWSQVKHNTINQYLSSFNSIQELLESYNRICSAPSQYSVIRIMKENQKARNTATYWLVKLDLVLDYEYKNLILKVNEVPVVGIAMLLNTETYAEDFDTNIKTTINNINSCNLLPVDSTIVMSDSIIDTNIDTEVSIDQWYQCNFEGKIYCYLPINDAYSTGLPFHIHGNYCLTDNRRDLWSKTTDQVYGQAKDWIDWNNLLYVYTAKTYLSTISTLKYTETILKYIPRHDKVNTNLLPLLQAISENILSINMFFKILPIENKLAYISKQQLSSFKLITLSKKVITAISYIFEIISKIDTKYVSINVSKIDMLNNFGALMTHILNEPCIVATNSLKHFVNKKLDNKKTISFLTCMYNHILPFWRNNMSINQLKNYQMYYIHWMFVLVHVLGNGSREEMLLFKESCNELKFLPIYTRIVDKTENVLSDVIAGDEEFIKSNLIDHYDIFPFINNNLNMSGNKLNWSLYAPNQLYDITLKSFNVSYQFCPIGLFTLEPCLTVLRAWGLKQTLSWTEMTQEIAIRICHTDKLLFNI